MDTQKTIEDQVRERAFTLWERDGRPEGQSEVYWHRAQSEVEAQGAEPGAELPENLAGEASASAVTE